MSDPQTLDQVTDILRTEAPEILSGVPSDDSVRDFVNLGRAEGGQQPIQAQQGGDTPDAESAVHRPPVPLTSRENIVAAQTQLAEAVQHFQQLFQGGHIDAGQFQVAMHNAETYARQIQDHDLALREHEIRHHHARAQAEARWHSEMSSGIPEWSDPEKRDGIITDLRNFFGNRGVPTEVMDMVDHPAVLAAAHRVVKEFRQAQRTEQSRLRSLRKERAAPPSAPMRNGSDEQLRAVQAILNGR